MAIATRKRSNNMLQVHMPRWMMSQTVPNPPEPYPTQSPQVGNAQVYTPISQQPKKRPSTIYILIGVVVAIVIIVGVLAASGVFSPKTSSQKSSPPPYTPPPPATITVATTGTVWNLNAGQYEQVGPVDLTSNLSWTISGSFTATNGVTAYVMNSSQYSNWGGSSSSPSSYYWTSGPDVSSGSVSVVLPTGIYYFVWITPNVFTSTSVDITSNVVATASG